MNDNLDKIREHRKKCHYAIYLMTHASINSRRVNCFVHEVRPGDLSLLWRRGGQGALTLLSNQRFMDVRDNTSTSNGRLDQSIQLFISSNRELKNLNYSRVCLHLFTSLFTLIHENLLGDLIGQRNPNQYLANDTI